MSIIFEPFFIGWNPVLIRNEFTQVAAFAILAAPESQAMHIASI
jgi:hypothetical protein